MAKGTIYRRHLLRSAFLLALCFLLSSSSQGQASFFSKYFEDVKKQRVELEPTRIDGIIKEGKVYISSQQIVEMALRQNLDINLQRYSYLSDFWVVKKGKSIYDPVGRFGLNWDRATTPTASVLEGGTSVTNITTSYNYGYQQNYSTGTSFEVNFTGVRNRSTSFFASLTPAINTHFEVILRQNLLEGFGRVAGDYEIEISNNNLKRSQQEFQHQAHEIILEALNWFYELQFSILDIKVKGKSLQLAQTVLQQNQARFQVGSAAHLEVVEMEAEVASRNEELIRSKFNYRRNQDQLVRLITDYKDPREFPGQIVPSDNLQIPEVVSSSFDQLYKQALRLRPEIQQAELNIANNKLNLDLSRNRLLPQLDLVAGYQQFGLGGRRMILDFSQGFTNAHVVGIVPGGLGDSFSGLFSRDFYGHILGLDLRVPIFNTEAQAENARAQIGVERSELARKSLAQRIATEIRDVLTQIEMNRASLEASDATIRFTRERLEGEQARFEAGSGTTRELVETQRDLLQAELVLLRAQVDLIKSYNLLDRSLGLTFNQHNVRLSEIINTNVH